MTRQRDFKALVRERMQKTGERYTAARAQLLSHSKQPALAHEEFPGVVSGYRQFGGVQGDTGALSNAMLHAGIVSALTRAPFSEAMLNGLCGGPGFLYAVFEYKGWNPMLTLTLRSRSMPDEFILDGISAAGLRVKKNEAASAAPARRALDASLDEGRAALINVGPRIIGVVGRDGDDYWLDDRRPRPMRVSSTELSTARSEHRKAKNRLIQIEGADAKRDLRKTIRDVAKETARRYEQPPVPKSFWSNCGFAGLEKWSEMLTNQKDKKGWPILFSEGPRAFAGLTRAYDWISCRSAPGAGRPFYADFLDEAADQLDDGSLRKAAAAFREAGARWEKLSTTIAQTPDSAVRSACEAADRRIEAGDESTIDSLRCHLAGATESFAAPDPLAASCKLTKGTAVAVFDAMAAQIRSIVEAEREAVRLLRL